MKALLLLFLFLSASITSLSRTFTSSDGLHTIEATLLAVDKPSHTVTIRRSDGRSFRAELSAFSSSDQAYAYDWLKGTKENYLSVGREYPSHLKIYLKLLKSGRIDYGYMLPNGKSLATHFYGHGPTPFLAWVDGYNRKDQSIERFHATQLSFDLINGNWEVWIDFRTGTSTEFRSESPYIGAGSFYGMTSVTGPSLYRQPQKIIYLNQNKNRGPSFVLPHGRAPVLFKSLGGAGGGFFSKSFSRGGFVSVKMDR